MLTRFYADNFKCFVNFELDLDERNVLLGGNGSGKTTVLDALRRIRALIARGNRVDEEFPARDLCLTQNRNKQRFELDLQSEDGFFQYVILIEHERDSQKIRIAQESLRYDGQPIFEFTMGKAQLYHEKNYEPGPSLPFPSTGAAPA